MYTRGCAHVAHPKAYHAIDITRGIDINDACPHTLEEGPSTWVFRTPAPPFVFRRHSPRAHGRLAHRVCTASYFARAWCMAEGKRRAKTDGCKTPTVAKKPNHARHAQTHESRLLICVSFYKTEISLVERLGP